MKVIGSKYFIISLGLYLTYQLVLLTDLQIAQVLTSYFNDLLCMPIVLCAILFTVRVLKKDKEFILPMASIGIVVIYWSIYFEWYLPREDMRCTADLVDVLLYLFGAATFILWQRISFMRVDARVYDR